MLFRSVGVLEALADHLSIDPAGFAGVSPAELAERVVPILTADRAFKVQQDLPPRPTLVPVLKEMYGPEVERIAKLLGRDLRRWVDGFGVAGAHPPLPRREVGVGASGHVEVNRWLEEGAAPAAALAAPVNVPLPGGGNGAT